MEDFLKAIYQQLSRDDSTLGIILVRKKHKVSAVTDNFEFILLVIVKADNHGWSLSHLDNGEKRAAVYRVDEVYLKRREINGISSRAREWVIEGDFIFDCSGYGEKLKQELLDFSIGAKEKEQAIEFAKLIRKYREAQEFYQTQQYLDANNAVVRTLHHLARLSIIEKDQHPELVVWKQMKEVDPEVYKLYQEFTESGEELEKRLSLMMIGIEFAVNRRAESCARHLIGIMKSRQDPWLIGELIAHPELGQYAFELSMMVEYLTSKGILEVTGQRQRVKDVYQRFYQVK